MKPSEGRLFSAVSAYRKRLRGRFFAAAKKHNAVAFCFFALSVPYSCRNVITFLQERYRVISRTSEDTGNGDAAFSVPAGKPVCRCHIRVNSSFVTPDESGCPLRCAASHSCGTFFKCCPAPFPPDDAGSQQILRSIFGCIWYAPVRIDLFKHAFCACPAAADCAAS